MSTFKNEKGNPVLMKMVNAIHENKDYLGEVDGLIGDGDHGMNMNKGFMLFGKQYGDKSFTFAEEMCIRDSEKSAYRNYLVRTFCKNI